MSGGTSTATSNTLSLINGASLNNAGTLTLLNGAQLGGYATSTSKSVITNSGTIVSNQSPNAYPYTNYIGNYYGVTNGTSFNNIGTVNVLNGSTTTASGTALYLADSSQIVNNGLIRIDAGASLATGSYNLTNSTTGTLSGTGTVNLSGYATLFNNGTVSPGSTANTGTLTINGNYTQGSTGTLVARIGGIAAGQFDKLQVSGNTVLDGAFTATAINGYGAVSGDALTVIGSTPLTSTVSGKFATVSLPPNLFPGYGLFSGAPFRLTYAPGGAVFFTNAGGDFNWNNPLNWSSKATPVSVNDVVINAGYTVAHASGDDIIDSLTVNQNNGLGVSGGSLSVTNISNIGGKLAVSGTGALNLNGGLAGVGTLVVDGGSVNLKGPSSIANLAMTSGTVSGDSNFAVSNSVAQSGGSLQFNNAAVSLRQASGDLTIGNLNAASATLQADTGAIHQGAAPIKVSALTTQSATGTRLDNAANVIGAFAANNSGSGDVVATTTGSLSLGSISDAAGNVILKSGGAISETGGVFAAALDTTSVGGASLNAANSISKFTAMNSGSGDISLTNVIRPNIITVAGVTNTDGNVALDNTGGIVTAGDISASRGGLKLTAHSPITVNSVLTARDGITLNALPSALAIDTITINGTLASALGNIALTAGTSASVASTATVRVASGNAINLTALAGSVSIVPGATFIGATPTISQVIPIPVAPVIDTPLPTLALNTVPTTIPTTIDSLQKAATPAISEPFDPSLLANLIVSNGNLSRPYLIEPATIGGTVDSFGGATSGGLNKSGDDKLSDGTVIKKSNGASRSSKALPVCN